MNDELDIRVKTPPELASGEYEEIIALTTQAFQKDYTPFMEMFVNPTHVLARLEGKLVSYVAWITRWLQIDNWPLLRTAYLEGMATELSYRHQGFATRVMKTAMEQIKDYDFAALSTGSTWFYNRLGWQVWQGPLDTRKEKKLIPMPEERGCVMVYTLPKTPPFDINGSLSIEWRELEPW